MAKGPYGAIIDKLVRKRVRFIVIGVSGINYYSTDASHMFSTKDYDILLEPKRGNLLAALRTLSRSGFHLESDGEPLGPVDEWLAERIIERKAMITASKGPGVVIDVVLEGGGLPFQQWRKNAKNFSVEGVNVRVGALQDLIASKENANREKDKAFLALYKIHLKEMLSRSGRKSKK